MTEERKKVIVNKLEHYTKLRETINSLIREEKRLKKYSERYDEVECTYSIQRIRELEHELHCLCVELGISKYEEDKYRKEDYITS